MIKICKFFVTVSSKEKTRKISDSFPDFKNTKHCTIKEAYH